LREDSRAISDARWGGSVGDSVFDGMQNHLREFTAYAYWRNYMSEDATNYLRQTQVALDTVRRMLTNAPGTEVLEALRIQELSKYQRLSSPLAPFRHLMSQQSASPSPRALEHTLRNETARRLTVTAIALKRHQLRHGRYPETLAGLAPGFLAAVPVDPWSGRPLCYRLTPQGGFILYSVGVDGVDDGGDATPPGNSTAPDLWSGRDVVWPLVEHEE
jgi:hypothetical protein